MVLCFVFICEVSWPLVIAAKCGPTICTWPHVPCLCEEPQYGRCPGDSGAWPSVVAGRVWWHIACVSARSIWHAAWMKKGDENLLYWHCLKPCVLLWILWYTLMLITCQIKKKKRRKKVFFPIANAHACGPRDERLHNSSLTLHGRKI